MHRILTVIVLVSAGALSAQAPEPPVVITIEIENAVLYRGNTFDIARIAKDQAPTTSVNTAFLNSVNVADIVALNGKAARGIWSYQVFAMPFRASPAPGQPIADIDGGGIFQCIWQVLAPDGTYLGTIMDSGAPPSAEHVVVGGSGAFFGMTGTHRGLGEITPQRGASTSEDPANRRIHGGGKSRSVLHLYPRFRPQVEMTPAGPAIFHADFSLVTAARPARPGETLIARATGLGPTRPNLESIRVTPFGESPLEIVNSPIEVSVNGKQAEVINSVGWPDTYDRYRVDFRVPSGLPPGTATIQLTAAWIPGAEVKITVQ